MQVKLNLNIKCNFCGNNEDEQFYIMPKEEEAMDGKYFSATEYSFVYKKCKHKKNIKISIEEGD